MASHCVQGEGDTVVARVLPNEPGKVVIESIEGDGGRLTLDPAKNCIGVAATETMKLLGQVSCGVSLKLTKVGAGSLQGGRTELHSKRQVSHQWHAGACAAAWRSCRMMAVHLGYPAGRWLSKQHVHAASPRR